MRRTTVLLPDDLATLLEHERRRRDVTTAAIVREALEAYLAGPQASRRLPFTGIGSSGRPGVARDAEAILSREWSGDDLAGSRGR